MPYLRRLNENNVDARSWTLGKSDFSVGRSEDADGQVEDSGLSKVHFIIQREGDRYFVVDNESTNSTFVNEGRIRRWS